MLGFVEGAKILLCFSTGAATFGVCLTSSFFSGACLALNSSAIFL
jgi:hypothetical protein